jgi:phosphosulfolactate synthase (CoM biosynthesis protein A)
MPQTQNPNNKDSFAMENPITSLLPFAYRAAKPRKRGLNYVRGPALLGHALQDTLQTYGPHIDVLKLSGHQASLSSEAAVLAAIAACKDNDVAVAVGNPVIDVALSGGQSTYAAVIAQLAKWSVDIVEISLIARSIDEEDLSLAIAIAKDHGVQVFAEIGVDFAHTRSEDHELFVRRRARLAATALEVGATHVLLESEGLTENRAGEAYRWDAIEGIVGGLDPARVIFEADDQDVMSRLIDIFGPKANLMVDSSRIEKVEAARRGFGPSQFLWGKVATLGPAE